MKQQSRAFGTFIALTFVACAALILGVMIIYNQYQTAQKTVVEPTGITEKHTQDLNKSIQQIVLEGAGTLYIEQNAKKQSLYIEVDQALLPSITVTSAGKILTLAYRTDTKVHLAKSIPAPRFYVSLADIAAITASGSAKIVSKNQFNVDSLDINAHGSSKIRVLMATKELDVKSSGSSTIILEGSANVQHVKLSGAATYTANNLKSLFTSITASGAFNAKLWTTDRLVGKVSGAGVISYTGHPVVQLAKSGQVVVHAQSK